MLRSGAKLTNFFIIVAEGFRTLHDGGIEDLHGKGTLRRVETVGGVEQSAEDRGRGGEQHPDPVAGRDFIEMDHGEVLSRVSLKKSA